MTLKEMKWDDIVPNITRVKSAVGTLGTITDKQRITQNVNDYKDDYSILWDNGNKSMIYWILSGNIEII